MEVPRLARGICTTSLTDSIYKRLLSTLSVAIFAVPHSHYIYRCYSLVGPPCSTLAFSCAFALGDVYFSFMAFSVIIAQCWPVPDEEPGRLATQSQSRYQLCLDK